MHNRDTGILSRSYFVFFSLVIIHLHSSTVTGHKKKEFSLDGWKYEEGQWGDEGIWDSNSSATEAKYPLNSRAMSLLWAISLPFTIKDFFFFYLTVYQEDR